MEKYEISDRYSATGTPRPDENSCDTCEGMGLYPEQKANLNLEAVKYGRLIIIGQKDKDGTPEEEDEYVFVRCPVCFGTRKNNSTDEEKVNAFMEKDLKLAPPTKKN